MNAAVRVRSSDNLNESTKPEWPDADGAQKRPWQMSCAILAAVIVVTIRLAKGGSASARAGAFGGRRSGWRGDVTGYRARLDPLRPVVKNACGRQLASVTLCPIRVKLGWRPGDAPAARAVSCPGLDLQLPRLSPDR